VSVLLNSIHAVKLVSHFSSCIFHPAFLGPAISCLGNLVPHFPVVSVGLDLFDPSSVLHFPVLHFQSTHIVSYYLDQYEATDVVYIYFAKAFYPVPRARLVTKLTGDGISGKLHNRIRHFWHLQSVRRTPQEFLFYVAPPIVVHFNYVKFTASICYKLPLVCANNYKIWLSCFKDKSKNVR